MDILSIETLDPGKTLLLTADQYLESKNFYAFCKDVMLRDLEPKPHQEMCSVAKLAIDSFEDYYVRGITPGPEDKNYYLCLTPRDSFKSTVWTECMPVYLALKHPDIRILIDSENKDKAMKFCSAGKEHFDSNRTLRSLYGDLTPRNRNDEVWTGSQYRLTSRKRIGLKEHTLMTCGIGTTMPGMHYDVIVCDDLVSEKNVTSFEQVEKVNEHIAYMQSLLSPGGLLFIIGTRWHFDDAYGCILKDKDLKSLYNIYIRSAGGPLDLDKHTGKPKPLYFPGRLTEAFLNKKLKAQKRFIFSCQYLNMPVPTGEQSFDVNKYRYINKKTFLKDIILQDKDGRPRGNFYWFFLVDPAITDEKKKRGDFTAISPYVVTPDGRKYLYRPLAVKKGEDEIIDVIYNHYISVKKDLGPSYNGTAHIESIAFQKLLLTMLKKKTEQHGQKIKWKELKQENRTNKEVRIRSAIPHLEDGDFWIVDDHPEPGPYQLKTPANIMLIDQATRFPECNNDDLLDNQGFIVEIAKTPKMEEDPQDRLDWEFQVGHSKKPKKPNQVKFDDDFDTLDEDDDDFNKNRGEYWPM